jgi:16S rRNA (uracil1498-N3)-methyltransferase
MNLILFEPEEIGRPLSLHDPRARHILDVLGRRPGDCFDAGIVDGPRGTATVLSRDPAGLLLEFTWSQEQPAALEPITLIVGLPRPQAARRLLEEATALGVQAMQFFVAEKAEASYAHSKLWTTDEWRRHLVAGAQQAFITRLPSVALGRSLADVIPNLPADSCRLALDNYEAVCPLSTTGVKSPAVLAIGPERGWSAPERDQLRNAGFELVHLGERVLRVETACIAALALLKAGLDSSHPERLAALVPTTARGAFRCCHSY